MFLCEAADMASWYSAYHSSKIVQRT